MCLREKDPSGPFGQVVAAFFNFNQAKVKRKAQQMHLFLNASMVLMTDGNVFLSWATFFSSFRDLDLGLNKSKMVTLKGEMDKLIQFVAERRCSDSFLLICS